MTKIYRLVIAAALALTASTLATADIGTIRNTSDLDSIRAAISNYVRGIKEKDAELLHTVFDVPNAHMKIIGKAEDGKQFVRVVPIADVIPRWVAWDYDGEHYAHILSIDIQGDRFATVSFDYNGLYWDQMTLFKINDTWKIVNKISMRTGQ